MPITYLKGDATQPETEGRKIILHICNDKGAWGAGFVLALSAHWPEPERVYRDSRARLCEVQIVQVRPDLCVANLVAQAGFPSPERRRAVDYGALTICLDTLAGKLIPGETLHMPRIGCGIAGGKWERIRPILMSAFPDREMYVYDLET